MPTRRLACPPACQPAYLPAASLPLSLPPCLHAPLPPSLPPSLPSLTQLVAMCTRPPRGSPASRTPPRAPVRTPRIPVLLPVLPPVFLYSLAPSLPPLLLYARPLILPPSRYLRRMCDAAASTGSTSFGLRHSGTPPPPARVLWFIIYASQGTTGVDDRTEAARVLWFIIYATQGTTGVDERTEAAPAARARALRDGLTALTERVAEGDSQQQSCTKRGRSSFSVSSLTGTPLAGKTKSGYGNAGSGVLPPDGPSTRSRSLTGAGRSLTGARWGAQPSLAGLGQSNTNDDDIVMMGIM